MRNFPLVYVAIGVPLVLLCMAAFGTFGANCQQLTVDVMNDMRSSHHIIHD